MSKVPLRNQLNKKLFLLFAMSLFTLNSLTSCNPTSNSPNDLTKIPTSGSIPAETSQPIDFLKDPVVNYYLSNPDYSFNKQEINTLNSQKITILNASNYTINQQKLIDLYSFFGNLPTEPFLYQRTAQSNYVELFPRHITYKDTGMENYYLILPWTDNVLANSAYGTFGYTITYDDHFTTIILIPDENTPKEHLKNLSPFQIITMTTIVETCNSNISFVSTTTDDYSQHYQEAGCNSYALPFYFRNLNSQTDYTYFKNQNITFSHFGESINSIPISEELFYSAPTQSFLTAPIP